MKFVFLVNRHSIGLHNHAVRQPKENSMSLNVHNCHLLSVDETISFVTILDDDDMHSFVTG